MSDSLLGGDSMDSVSSDGGEYQDLPIIVDSAGNLSREVDIEQGMNTPNDMKNAYKTRELNLDP